MKTESLGFKAVGLVVAGALFVGWVNLGAALMPERVHYGEGYPFEFLVFLVVYFECLFYPLVIVLLVGENAPVFAALSLLSLALIDFWPSGALFFAVLTLLHAFLVLSSSKETRRLVFGAFLFRSDRETDDARKKLLGAAGATGILTLSLLCLEHRSVYIYAIASVSLCVVVLLGQRSLASHAKESALSYVILEKLGEPLLVAAIAGVCCAIFSLYVQSFLIESLRISTIKYWIELQERGGAFIENVHVPGWQIVLALLALWVLRVVLAGKWAPRMTGPLNITMNLIRVLKKAASLGYLAIVVVCSFAFLSEQADGPVESLQSRGRSIESAQLDMQLGVYRLVRDACARDLLERVWAQQNVLIRAQIKKLNEQIARFDEGPVAHFNELEKKYKLENVAAQTEVGKRYRALRRIGSSVNYRLELPKPSPSDSLTIAELQDTQRVLTTEEDRAAKENNPDAQIEMLVGLDSAMAWDLFDAVIPIDKLAEHAQFVEALGQTFPAAKEILGKVADGAKEFTFQGLWGRANRALEAFLQRRASTLAEAARAQVETVTVMPVIVIEVVPLRSDAELTEVLFQETRLVDDMARRIVTARALGKWRALGVASEDPLNIERYSTKSAMQKALDTYKQQRSLEALATLDATLDSEVAQVITKVSIATADKMEAVATKKYPRPKLGLGSHPVGGPKIEPRFEPHPVK